MGVEGGGAVVTCARARDGGVLEPEREALVGVEGVHLNLRVWGLGLSVECVVLNVERLGFSVRVCSLVSSAQYLVFGVEFLVLRVHLV